MPHGPPRFCALNQANLSGEQDDQVLQPILGTIGPEENNFFSLGKWSSSTY